MTVQSKKYGPHQGPSITKIRVRNDNLVVDDKMRDQHCILCLTGSVTLFVFEKHIQLEVVVQHSGLDNPSSTPN